jgi:hypothetical protein
MEIEKISKPENTHDFELYEAYDCTNNEDDPNYYLTIVA